MPPQKQGQRQKQQVQLSELERFISDNVSDDNNEMLYNTLELKAVKSTSETHKSITQFGSNVFVVHGLITVIPESILSDPALCFMGMSVQIPFRVGFCSDMHLKSYKVYPLFIRFVSNGHLLEDTLYFYNNDDRKRYSSAIGDLLRSNYAGGDEGSELEESHERYPTEPEVVSVEDIPSKAEKSLESIVIQ